MVQSVCVLCLYLSVCLCLVHREAINYIHRKRLAQGKATAKKKIRTLRYAESWAHGPPDGGIEVHADKQMKKKGAHKRERLDGRSMVDGQCMGIRTRYSRI